MPVLSFFCGMFAFYAFVYLPLLKPMFSPKSGKDNENEN